MPTDALIQIFDKVKPIVLISQCLELSACRYDGALVRDDFIKRLKQFVEFLTVCPEIEIGLGVPRDPIRLVADKSQQFLVQPSTSLVLTQRMNSFSESFVDSLTAIDGAILKSRSPSCGVGDTKVFKNTRTNKSLRKGSGLFAQTVIDRFTDIPIKDERALKDTHAREHFLIRLFTMARFRLADESNSFDSLRQFHEQHRDLFEVYNKRSLAILDRLLSTTAKGRKSIIDTFRGRQTSSSATSVELLIRAELNRMFARRTNRGHEIKTRYYPEQLQSF